ncbi:MAG: thioredoxin domain-containing protein [Lachnospiraceae bacterium]
MKNATRVPNRLINEKSPYLLQHVYNPVDWWPWCEEAFAKAKVEDKPVFLSIGYSSCHWCHVMEQESFEDKEVATLLNQNFICIKVDREERPDIDSVYMSVCQALTRSGGWPLTIIMTPEQHPFYAATYLPKYNKYGSMGLMELLPQISRLWRTQKNVLTERGDHICSYLLQSGEDSACEEIPQTALLEEAVITLVSGFDKTNGGFHAAPKFPSPHVLLFLLRFAVEKQSKESDDLLRMVTKTLDHMFRGGIFDHIGGGFSRYSTDDKWLVPHFEKMLYDNALLAYLYLEAYQFTEKEHYRQVAVRTLDYMLKELRGEDGGFCCGQDADSEGVEGKYYVFTPDEVKKVLGQEDGNYFCSWFSVTEQGNFEGKSILNLLENADFERIPENLPVLLNKMYQYRLNRYRLHRDDKILTSWNGLAISAFAKAYLVLGEERYYAAAVETRDFIKEKLTDKDGRLYVRYRDSESAGIGMLDDYAFYSWGLLELYQCQYDLTCLEDAIVLTDIMHTYFYDMKAGGYFLNASYNDALISRPKELYDGALPSGNSIAALILVQLSHVTGDQNQEASAYQQLSFLAGRIKDYPAGYTAALTAMLPVLYESVQIVCTAEELPDWKELHHILVSEKLLNLTFLVKTRATEKGLSCLAPFTKDYPIMKSKTAFYVCKNHSCLAPVYSLEELQRLLKK